MKLKYPALLALLLSAPSVFAQVPSVVINEVDADTPSTDSAEFVELYDGGIGNTDLAGLSLVLYNGNGDVSYKSFSLDGHSTNNAGYFVLCGNNTNVANCDLDVSPDTNLIQNGADAVALYIGVPESSAVTTDNLIDAIVYDTDDNDDAGLLLLLNSGQPQVNEKANGASDTESSQRCANGSGGTRNTSSYAQYSPTPGAENTCGTDSGGDDDTTSLGVISGSVCTNCPDVPIIKDISLFDAASYYAAAQIQIDSNASTEVLKAAVNSIISADHKNLSYSEVWTSLTYTDEDPSNTDNVILWYDGRSQAKSTNGSGDIASGNPDNWNREHSWPKSHGFSSSSTEAYTDIHHLRPTDISINSSRDNLDFDNSDAPLAESPENRIDGDSFEPRTDIKGDVARMMFYMDTRYEGLNSDSTPDLLLVNRATTSSESKLGWLCTLIAWSAADPVDSSEELRNDRIYQLQGNRNPFIDNPAWVEILYPAADCGSDGGGGEGPGDGENPGDGSEPGDASGVGAILITEVMQNPSAVGDSVGEWFEIVNSGTQTLNLNGWTVRDNGSDSFVIAQDIILAPGAYAIFGRNADTSVNGGVSVDYEYGTTMALANGDDELILEDITGTIVDEITWDGGPIWPDPTGASMTLVDFSGSNNDGTKWVAEPTETYGNGDKGTPGKSDAIFSLVITEIMQNPSAVSDGSGEWFEVLNTGAIAANLNGWTLRDDGTDSHLVEGDVFIAPGTYAVFSNNSDSASNGGVEVIYQYSGIFLANGSDELVLQRPDSSIEDQVNWDDGATFPDPNGKSMTLTSAFVDNNLGSNWIEETTKSYGNGDFGTPGSGPDGTGAGGGDTGGGPVELVFIHDVQGSGDASPLEGDTVIIEGVVSASYSGMSGFFVQEEDADADADASTSEGIFVSYDGELPAVGSLVSVIGDVSEFFDRTQLTVTEAPVVINTGNTLPTASALSLPFSTLDQAESLEGMLVSTAQALVVTDNFTLGRFGQVTLSTERLFTPTNVFAPGSDEANNLAAANALNRILLDDGDNTGNPELVVFPTGGLSASNTLRLGDTVASLTGVVDYSFGDYRVIPTQDPTFVATNPRIAEPDLNLGNLKVASLNMLNYFNGIDGSGSVCGPTSSSGCRGADSDLEFERQKAKAVAAIVAMDADIVGLMEIENNGFTEGSAIADLVAAINAIMGAGTYSIVNPGAAIGTDAITVAFIYKSNAVSLSGPAKILDSSNSISDDDGVLFVDTKNRPSLIQEFALVENGETLVISVNHLKSKGSGCGAGDDDATTGQGNCNLTRTRAAQAISAFLDTHYPDTATLIIGDLNAYAKEDPISALEVAGYTNLVNYFGGAEAYSYSFSGLLGYLDHALANNKALAKVVDVAEWHINADEPVILDYNLENKTANNVTDYYADDAYRMSDHDPVLIALQFDAPVAEAPETDADVNQDGSIDFADYMAIYGMLGSSTGDANYNAIADYDTDGAITYADLQAWYQLYLGQ